MSNTAELRSTEPLIGSLVKFAMGSVGSKVMMAATGFGIWLWFVLHIGGNLTAFLGRDTFNHYAEALQNNPPALWGQRVAMLLGVPLHVFFAIRSIQLNNIARPVPYAYQNKTPASLAARTMAITGLIIAGFIVYHLAHFTWRIVHVTDALGPDGKYSPYDMLVQGFRSPLVAGLYMVVMVLLAQHLSHGIASVFRHLGVWGRRVTPFLTTASFLIGYAHCLAALSIPAAVLFGIIKS